MSSLTELSPSLPSTVSVEDMSQPVTTPASSELASQLEELSGLASQIYRLSNELQRVTQSDSLVSGTSVCVPLSLALSNARSCLANLQLVSQTPIPPPSPLPFVPPALSLTPTPIIVETIRPISPTLSSPAHGDVDMKQEEAAADALLALAEPCYEKWSVATDTAHPPTTPLEPSSPFRHTPPPTQRWPLSTVPLPPIVAPFEHFTQIPGGRLDSGYPPSSPLFSHRTPARQSVPLAELVDEEGSSPDTRGGMRSFLPPATTWAKVLQDYPPLSIITVDVTPPFARRANPRATEIPEDRSLRSSPLPLPETPEFSTIPVPTPPQGSLTSSGSRTPRRPKRKGGLPVDLEVPDRRVTRRRTVKGQTTEDFGIGASPPPKRARTSSP